VAVNKSPESIDREMIFGALIEIKKDLMDLKKIAFHQGQSDAVPVAGNNGEVKSLKQLEREAILNALDKTKWNKKKAASFLEISERTLFRKIKEYGLQ